MGSTLDNSEVLVLPAAFRQLLDGGESSLVEELIVIFQEDAAERLSLLARAVDAADYSTIRQEAHTIKGSALQVGANRVAEASRQVEVEARKPEPENLVPLYRALVGSFEEVRGVIAARHAAGDGSLFYGQ
jgi:HPt (histidine-containing phosphotransfer) domain-containing protein